MDKRTPGLARSKVRTILSDNAKRSLLSHRLTY
jgi:hypothetical protein